MKFECAPIAIGSPVMSSMLTVVTHPPSHFALPIIFSSLPFLRRL